MNKEVSDNKLLASLAVFRRLDKEGKKINEILSEFLIDIIKFKHLKQFTASEINTLLDEMYDFQIPDAVVRTALKKIDFISMEHHQYTITSFEKLEEYDLDAQQKEMLQKNDQILEKLYVYIETTAQRQLSEEEKKEVEKSFTTFILDNAADNGYSDYISAYIIDHKEDKAFMGNLEMIKEGVILYTGLKFNPYMNLTSPWKEKLTIYLNTELLFHLAGFNGELYKELFFDFVALVKDINKKEKYIRLKYFKETKDEIESFFYSAEQIVKTKSSLAASSTAMRKIVNGCKDNFDVLMQKEQVYTLLKTYGILEEEEMDDVYDEKNYKYNMSEAACIKKYSDYVNEDYIKDILKKLNYISIKRGEREKNNFENIGYILLTENSKINMLAWDEDIKEKGDVPLATNLQFITNKLWFKLNKGFGSGNYPTTFKIITKAQILLAAHLSDKLNEEYKELQKRVKTGEMSEEVALRVLYELKNRSKMPEDLYDADISLVLATITEKKLDDYALQHENIVQKAKEQKEVNIGLAKNIESVNEEKKNILRDKEQVQEENELLQQSINDFQRIKDASDIETYQLKKSILEDKQKLYRTLKRNKQEVDDESDKEYGKFKRYIGLGFLVYYVVIFFAIEKYTWNVMEQWTWILTFALPILFSVIYSFIKEKSFHIIEALKEKRNDILKKNYKKNNLDIQEIDKLSLEIEKLEQELKD